LVYNLSDAAKRKQLPAWIREGLEKMERKKQRKIEQEQSFNEPDHSSFTKDNVSQEMPNVYILFVYVYIISVSSIKYNKNVLLIMFLVAY